MLGVVEHEVEGLVGGVQVDVEQVDDVLVAEFAQKLSAAREVELCAIMGCAGGVP